MSTTTPYGDYGTSAYRQGRAGAGVTGVGEYLHLAKQWGDGAFLFPKSVDGVCTKEEERGVSA